MKKKIALLLAAVMIISLMPMTVFGASAGSVGNAFSGRTGSGNANTDANAANGNDHKVFSGGGGELVNDDRTFNADRTRGHLSTITWEDQSIRFEGFPTLSIENGTLTRPDGFLNLDLTNAEWSIPDSGFIDPNGYPVYRADGTMFIGTAAVYSVANGNGTFTHKLFAIDRNSPSTTYARVTFYDYITSTETLAPEQLPDATGIYYANTSATGAQLSRASTAGIQLSLADVAGGAVQAFATAYTVATAGTDPIADEAAAQTSTFGSVVLPIILKITSNTTIPRIRVEAVDSTGSNSNTLNIFPNTLAERNRAIVAAAVAYDYVRLRTNNTNLLPAAVLPASGEFTFAVSRFAGLDDIQVFYQASSLPTNPNATFSLGRISIQEYSRRITRFNVNVDSQFTVLPVHPYVTTATPALAINPAAINWVIANVSGATGLAAEVIAADTDSDGLIDGTNIPVYLSASTTYPNGTLMAGYVRRYITLTAPEGYHWDYNENLNAAIRNGTYNLMFNPTGIFAADQSRPAWLMVDQTRNNPNVKTNELVLDLDFLANPQINVFGNHVGFEDNPGSFQIAPGMLRLVRDNSYVVSAGTLPVKLTISGYDNAHIVTRTFDVANFTGTQNITLTSAASTATVIGGAYGFADNSASVQSAEVGTPMGQAIYREGAANQADRAELRFNIAGATMVGAKIEYADGSGDPVHFGSDSRHYIPAGRTARRLNVSGGAVLTNDNVTATVGTNNTITIANLTDLVGGVLTVKITPYVVASVDTEGADVTVHSEQTNLSSAWVPATVTVGKALVPVTAVVAEQAKGSLGKNITGGTLIVEETQPGVINRSIYQPASTTPQLTSSAIGTRELTVTLQNDVFGTLQFMDNVDVTSKVNIVPGTGTGLSVASARTDAAGVLRITFNGVSTVAAQVEIKDIPFAANRLTYNGDYAAFVGGSAIAANYNNGVIANSASPINADIKVASFVNVADTNLGVVSSIDTIDGKDIIAQLTISRTDDGVVGSVRDVVSNMDTVLDPSPIIKGGRTYIPLRVVSETLGIPVENVDWDAATNTAIIESEERVVYFTKDSKTYTIYINGLGATSYTMDAEAFNLNGSMYIPVRYLAHGLFDGTAQEDATSTANDRVVNIYSAQ